MFSGLAITFQLAEYPMSSPNSLMLNLQNSIKKMRVWVSKTKSWIYYYELWRICKLFKLCKKSVLKFIDAPVSTWNKASVSPNFQCLRPHWPKFDVSSNWRTREIRSKTVWKLMNFEQGFHPFLYNIWINYPSLLKDTDFSYKGMILFWKERPVF